MKIRLNCNRSNADERKLVDFVAKQRRVHAEYGFWLSAQRRTKEEEDGFRRYRKDYRCNYYREHYETECSQMKAYAASHRKTPTAEDVARQAAFEAKKRLVKAQYGFELGVIPIEMTPEERETRAAERAAQAKAREEARLAAKDAKRAAKEAEAAAKAERKALLAQAYATFKYKLTAYKRKTEKMRKHLKLPKNRQEWTPEQKAQWNDYLATRRKELEDWLVERMRKELVRSPKSASRDKQVASSLSADLITKREAREKRRREVFEKYGFHLGRKPVTPDEIAGFKRWQRDQEAEYRERHRDRITEYNREYRRRKRQEAREAAQSKWTPAQWATWEKKQASKERGSPQWLVKEVVKHLAAEHDITENQVTERFLELGGLDFLIAGAESLGAIRCRTKGAVLAAVRALALYLDPDRAEMFKKQE